MKGERILAKPTLSRRGVLQTALLLGAAQALPAWAAERSAADRSAAGSAPTPPGLEYAFAAHVTLDPPQELGEHSGRRSRFIPINGGTVTGPRLQGRVLPGGGDWQEIGGDGVTQIHARYFLEAEDGTVIGVDNAGLRVPSPEVIARLTAGEDLDPALYYFRTTTRFEVVAGPHEWLRRALFICNGVRRPNHVELIFFQIL